MSKELRFQAFSQVNSMHDGKVDAASDVYVWGRSPKRYPFTYEYKISAGDSMIKVTYTFWINRARPQFGSRIFESMDDNDGVDRYTKLFRW